MNKEEIKELLIYVGIGAVIFYVLYKVLQKVGIVDTPEAAAEKKKEAAAKDAVISSASPLSPQWYKSHDDKATDLYPESLVKLRSDNIYGALGLSYGILGRADDDSVIGEIKKVDNQAKLFQISEKYRNDHGSDMQADLSKHLSGESLKLVADYIASLPTGQIQ